MPKDIDLRPRRKRRDDDDDDEVDDDQSTEATELSEPEPHAVQPPPPDTSHSPPGSKKRNKLLFAGIGCSFIALCLIVGVIVLLIMGHDIESTSYPDEELTIHLKPDPPKEWAPGGKSVGGKPAAEWQGDKVKLGIAYGIEKERWLTWAVEEFRKTQAGQQIEIDLIPKGPLEGAHAILAHEERIHIWAPTSAVYTRVFRREWQSDHQGDPITREENLAMSPMVFVFWDERYQAFHQRFPTTDFTSINKAIGEAGSSSKFGHAHPVASNSGLMTLVLMAHDFRGTSHGLSVEDVIEVDFLHWLKTTSPPAGDMSQDAYSLLQDMVLKGPATYDGVMVSENVAIDLLKNAKTRWGKLRIIYPERNIWNENPMYVLNVPWSSAVQQKAASVFMDFMLNERIQRRALEQGLRPANLTVPIGNADSPFVMYQDHGIQLQIQQAVGIPPGAVIQNLLASWQRAVGSR